MLTDNDVETKVVCGGCDRVFEPEEVNCEAGSEDFTCEPCAEYEHKGYGGQE